MKFKTSPRPYKKPWIFLSICRKIIHLEIETRLRLHQEGLCGRFAPVMAQSLFKFVMAICPIHPRAGRGCPPVRGDPPKATYRSLALSVAASLQVWPDPCLKKASLHDYNLSQLYTSSASFQACPKPLCERNTSCPHTSNQPYLTTHKGIFAFQKHP